MRGETRKQKGRSKKTKKPQSPRREKTGKGQEKRKKRNMKKEHGKPNCKRRIKEGEGGLGTYQDVTFTMTQMGPMAYPLLWNVRWLSQRIQRYTAIRLDPEIT